MIRILPHLLCPLCPPSISRKLPIAGNAMLTIRQVLPDVFKKQSSNSTTQTFRFGMMPPPNNNNNNNNNNRGHAASSGRSGGKKPPGGPGNNPWGQPPDKPNIPEEEEIQEHDPRHPKQVLLERIFVL